MGDRDRNAVDIGECNTDYKTHHTDHYIWRVIKKENRGG